MGALPGKAQVTVVTPANDSAMDETNDAVRVNVVAGSTAGTQYTEGDVDTTITGTTAMMEVAANVLQPVQGTVVDGLLVNLGANNDVGLNAGTNNIGDVDVLTVPAPLSTTGGGTEAAALRVTVATDSTGVLSVDDNGGAITVDWAGTAPPIGAGTEAAALRVTVATDSTGVLSVDDNGGSLTVDQGVAGTAWEVIGDVAHDAVAVANPVVIGAQMETMADSAPGTRSGTDGDATKLATTDGALFVITTGPQTFTYNATGVLTAAQVHAAPAAGLSVYITDIEFSVGAATASSIKLLLNGGADIWGPHYVEAINGRGLTIKFATPLKATAANRVDVTTTGAATQSTSIQGIILPG